MITVRKTESGFEPITGNPTLTSLDGARKAPLRVILHSSWTPQDRAQYGIYQVEPVEVPAGKRVTGEPTYELRGDRVVQTVSLEDALPAQVPPEKAGRLAAMQKQLDALVERVAALEAKA